LNDAFEVVPVLATSRATAQRMEQYDREIDRKILDAAFRAAAGERGLDAESLTERTARIRRDFLPTPKQQEERRNRIRDGREAGKFPYWGTGDEAYNPKPDQTAARAVFPAFGEDAVEFSDQGFRLAERAALEFEQLAIQGTGTFDRPEVRKKKAEQKATLHAQGHTIAAALEELGLGGYRSGEWRLWRYFVNSGEVEALPSFARTCFNPVVAAQVRAEKLLGAEYYLDRQMYGVRFWTFTSGARCRVKKVRRRLQQLHRRLSALNHWLKKEGYPVELVMRASELGSLEKKNRSESETDESGLFERDGGGYWYHPHAHCLVRMKALMTEAQWSGMLKAVWGFWKHNWDEGKRIKSAREAVKYVSKPGQIIALAKTAPGEFKRLFTALRGLKMVQPMGELKRELSARKKSGLVLEKRKTPDGFGWIERFNHNKRGGSSDGEKHVTAAKRMEKRFKGGFSVPDQCAVMAAIRPTANSLGIRESAVICCGSRWDAAKITNHPLVTRLRNATSRDYHAGLALFRAESDGASVLRVHTGTPTVSTQSVLDFDHDVERRKRPWTPPIHEKSDAETLSVT
jgi:hypothetical protein